MPLKSITALRGVYASAIKAGIKKVDALDLAYLFVPGAVGSAGVFTKNAFMAPPIVYTKRVMAKGIVKAVIINAGNANAATGEQGLQDARETATLAARLMRLHPSEVAVASTGIIGVPLPMQKIRGGLELLLSNPRQRSGQLAAKAIMTTDTYSKEVFMTKTIGSRRVTVAGFAKGSGMIAPNMATMLGYLVTDASVDSATLHPLLRKAVDDSFNMTSVDTDVSTNDMVLLFATGEKKIALRKKAEREAFQSLLTESCQQLAKLVARDGEGATKLIEVTVLGAKTTLQARAVAKNIVDSPLVKTAIHGADPNWGRVAAAVGKDPEIAVLPDRVDIKFAGIPVMKKGEILNFDRQLVIERLQKEEVQIVVNLNVGNGRATSWGCDLTKGYVDINTCYS